MSTFTRTQKRWLVAIILLYAILGVIYARATPPLESSDEYKHYPVVQYVQTQGHLPVLDPDNPGKWLQAGAQPPLYYGLMALLTAPLDTSDLDAIHVINPHVSMGDVNQVGNRNLIIHDPAREAFPWQGSILAVYFIRFASIGLGVGTILTTAVLGSTLYSPAIGLLAAALTAFNPMFLFVSAAVNNDSLAILLGHIGLLLLVKLWQDAPAPHRAWPHYVLLGFVLGLGVLTKLSLGGLLPLAGLALAERAWRSRRPLLFWLGGPLVAGTALLVSGWWFVRNWRLYGDLTGLNAFIAVQGTRAAPLALSGWIEEFGTLYRSYWGLFGGVSIAAPDPFYLLSNLLITVGLLGFGWTLLRHRHERHQRAVWLLLGWIGILAALLIRWNIISPAFQGRLIFPGLGAINIIWVVGLSALWPARLKSAARRRAALVLASGYAVAALLIPWVSIQPAYAYPQPLTAVPDAAQFGPYTFTSDHGTMRLVGMEMTPGQTIRAGGNDQVAITLYWQATTPIRRDFVTSVHLLGAGSESVGQMNRYPAAGMIPTSRWQPQAIYRDEYRIYVQDDDAPAPAQLRVSVSLYDPVVETAVPATDPANQAIDLLLAGPPAKLLPADWPDPAGPPLATLGDGIQLTRAMLGQTTAVPGDLITIDVQWQVDTAPGRSLTTLIHLAPPNTPPLVTGDSPPRRGSYPTDLWAAGEVIDDPYTLAIPADLPNGRYPVWIGMYAPDTLERLPLSMDGERQPADAYQIGWVEIVDSE